MAKAKAKTPKIDPEFRDFLPHPGEEAKAELRASIVRDGIIQPLIVWEETGILVDGHRRFEIAKALKLAFRVKVISFPDRNAVLAWMAAQQVSRRNLTPAEMKYFRGREYLAKVNSGNTNAATEVAEKHGVSQRTVHRDAAFAKQVDAAVKTGVSKSVVLEAANKKANALYCSRCTRNGPVRSCPRCLELQKAAGKTKKNPFGKKSSGDVKFTFEAYQMHLGYVVRGLDEIAKQYPSEKGGLDHTTVSEACERFVCLFNGWQSRLTGKKV